MDNFFDDFINYDNQYEPQLDLLEPNFTLGSPFSHDTDSTGLFPTFMPKTIQNLLDTDQTAPNKPSTMFDGLFFASDTTNSQKPLDFLTQNREECTESSEMTETIVNTPSPASSEAKEEVQSKLNSKTKKITKPKKERTKKDKDKPKKKMDAETLLKKADTKHIPEELYDPNLDSETKKKLVQMVRNRVSAQNSRDKKKSYLHQLEDENNALKDEKATFSVERNTLLQRIQTLEAEKAKLIQECDDFKNSEFLCSKCKCTMEFSDPDPSTNRETNGSTGESNPSSPGLSRTTSQGGRFFGFSFAFAAVLCFLMFINGGQLGSDFTASGSGKSTKLMALTRKLMNELDTGVCEKPEEKVPRPTMSNAEGLLNQIGGLTFGDFPILNKIKPLMEQFDRHHATLYQSFEANNKNVIQLANTQTLEQKAVPSKLFNSTNSFLGRKKSLVTSPNKTSTLFCPSGFEFYENTPKMGFDEEFKMNPEISGLEPRSRTLDIEKADYVQLLLPKQSIGRMGVTDNSSGIENLPFYQKAEEENSLIEVWCKIFAIKDIAASF